jgi:hypothetical protein
MNRRSFLGAIPALLAGGIGVMAATGSSTAAAAPARNPDFLGAYLHAVRNAYLRAGVVPPPLGDDAGGLPGAGACA